MEQRQRALVKRAMRGSTRAFEELIRGEQEYLYRVAFLSVKNEADALDAVQEAVLKAYKSLKTLREPAFFHTWLTKILINTAQDLLRARRENLPLEEGMPLPAPEVGLPPEDRMDLYQALEGLPEKYRDVVKLKYLDGYTIREISQKTGMPQGTVSVYLRRAVKELQVRLKEEPV